MLVAYKQPVLCVFLPDIPFSVKTCLMLSTHLHFSHNFLLFCTSITSTLLPTYSSSLLMTCSYHFNLLSCTFVDISSTFVVRVIFRASKVKPSFVTHSTSSQVIVLFSVLMSRPLLSVMVLGAIQVLHNEVGVLAFLEKSVTELYGSTLLAL